MQQIKEITLLAPRRFVKQNETRGLRPCTSLRQVAAGAAQGFGGQVAKNYAVAKRQPRIDYK